MEVVLEEVIDFLKMMREEGHTLDTVITILENNLEEQNSNAGDDPFTG